MRPEEELRYLVLGTQREGARLLAARLKPTGLTPAQAEVLGVLAGSPGIALVDLGAHLICEGGSPSRLVDSLVRASLVRREAGDGDRRRVQLSLTAAGTLAAEEVRAAEDDLHEAIRDRLDGEDVRAALQLLRRLAGDGATLRALGLRAAAGKARE